MEFLKGSTLAGSAIAYKYKAKVEVTDNDKRSSLLRYGINYGRKNFYNTGHCFDLEFNKSFFVTNICR